MGEINESTFSSIFSSQKYSHHHNHQHYQQQQQQQPQTSGNFSRTKRTRGKTYMSVGPGPSNANRLWLSRSAPTTPSGATPSPGLLFHQKCAPAYRYQEYTNGQQAVPLLLAEQEENDQASGAEGS